MQVVLRSYVRHVIHVNVLVTIFGINWLMCGQINRYQISIKLKGRIEAVAVLRSKNHKDLCNLKGERRYSYELPA